MRRLLAVLLALSLAGHPAAARDVRSAVPADPAAGDPSLAGEVAVLARVSAIGLVDSARALRGDPRLYPCAEASVRWWVFAPARGASAETVRVSVPAAGEVEPLRPDVIEMAQEAERQGDLEHALTFWAGVLNRVGRYPLLRNEWAIREHVIELDLQLPQPLPPPPQMWAKGNTAHRGQQRAVSTSAHAELLPALDLALLGAPWWNEAYLWRAGSQLGCGRTSDALRSLRAYRLGVRDSAGRATAGWVLARLGAGDTLVVCERIKNLNQVHRAETDD